MNWTMPYPWRSRRDSVRRINKSSEPGNELFFCALRPIPRILSLQLREYASQDQIVKPSPARWFGVLTRAGCESLWRELLLFDKQATSNLTAGVKGQSARASSRQAGGDPVGREVADAPNWTRWSMITRV
jgi:hypothetical protein